MSRLRQQSLILIIVAVFAGLPVVGSVCLALCADGQNSALPAPASAGHRAGHCIDGASEEGVAARSLHSCGRLDVAHLDGMIGVAPGRGDTSVLLRALATHTPGASRVGSVLNVRHMPVHDPPISPPLPVRAPLVLRI